MRRHTVGMTRSAFSEPKRRVLSLALVALITAGCGGLPLTRPGQTPRPTPTPVPTFDPERTGFNGKVVDVDGNPIEGVHLVIMLNSRRGTAATTAEGTFFSHGVVGVAEITASLEGYETEELTVTIVPNEIGEIEIVLVAAGD
jgi:Carboxypeptidase regulatory-like domain